MFCFLNRRKIQLHNTRTRKPSLKFVGKNRSHFFPHLLQKLTKNKINTTTLAMSNSSCIIHWTQQRKSHLHITLWMGRWRLPSLLLTHMARTHENCNFNLFSHLEHLQSLKSPLFDRCFFFNLRHFSAIPHRLCTELDSGSVDFHPNYGLADEDEEIGKIPVKAYFLSTRLAWSYLGFVEEEIPVL